MMAKYAKYKHTYANLEKKTHKLLTVIDHAPLFKRESTQLTDA